MPYPLHWITLGSRFPAQHSLLIILSKHGGISSSLCKNLDSIGSAALSWTPWSDLIYINGTTLGSTCQSVLEPGDTISLKHSLILLQDLNSFGQTCPGLIQLDSTWLYMTVSDQHWKCDMPSPKLESWIIQSNYHSYCMITYRISSNICECILVPLTILIYGITHHCLKYTSHFFEIS